MQRIMYEGAGLPLAGGTGRIGESCNLPDGVDGSVRHVESMLDAESDMLPK
jgi:hypothetical protein